MKARIKDVQIMEKAKPIKPNTSRSQLTNLSFLALAIFAYAFL